MGAALIGTGMEAYHYITFARERSVENYFYIPSQKIVIKFMVGDAFHLLEDQATLAEAQKVFEEKKYSRVITIDDELCDRLVSYGRAVNQAESQLQESKGEFEKSSKTLVELTLAAGKKSG